MSNTDSHAALEGSGSSYRVEAPRVGDSIGTALRDAYARDLGIPDDMAAMLRRLNGKTEARNTH